MDSPDCGGSMQIDNNKRNRKARNQKWFSSWPANKTWLCERFRSFGVVCGGAENMILANICESMGTFRPILTMELYELIRRCFGHKHHSSVSIVLLVCRVSADNICRPISALIWPHRDAIAAKREIWDLLTRNNHVAWVENELKIIWLNKSVWCGSENAKSLFQWLHLSRVSLWLNQIIQKVSYCEPDQSFAWDFGQIDPSNWFRRQVNR